MSYTEESQGDAKWSNGSKAYRGNLLLHEGMQGHATPSLAIQ